MPVLFAFRQRGRDIIPQEPNPLGAMPRGARVEALRLVQRTHSDACGTRPAVGAISSSMKPNNPKTQSLPASIDATLDLLSGADYVADRSLATVLFLALRMGRPLFLEGEAGVGKTEIAKVLSATLGRRLIRLQCYEGLDVSSAVYEWNYAAQMIEIR